MGLSLGYAKEIGINLYVARPYVTPEMMKFQLKHEHIIILKFQYLKLLITINKAIEKMINIENAYPFAATYRASQQHLYNSSSDAGGSSNSGDASKNKNSSSSSDASEASSSTECTLTKSSLSSLCKQLNQNRLEFKIISVFEDSTDYENFISDNYIHKKTPFSSLNKSSYNCKLKLRIFNCQLTNKYFVCKFGEHNGSITALKKTRGINVTVKNCIKTILDEDKDIIPSCILDRLINVHNIAEIIIPSLKQNENYVSNFRNRKINQNSNSSVLDIVKEQLYDDDLDEKMF
ncbi:unnamed protein product [Brachionus calyciflorus]|uniref:Uncharacterized protein n=1 Tax=Brachionus calyciflorus TaxID=104777 RepID=A0A814AW46_9BILA|nr:unnamed protein product [Brachionus calyciflorus]